CSPPEAGAWACGAVPAVPVTAARAPPRWPARRASARPAGRRQGPHDRCDRPSPRSRWIRSRAARARPPRAGSRPRPARAAPAPPGAPRHRDRARRSGSRRTRAGPAPCADTRPAGSPGGPDASVPSSPRLARDAEPCVERGDPLWPLRSGAVVTRDHEHCFQPDGSPSGRPEHRLTEGGPCPGSPATVIAEETPVVAGELGGRTFLVTGANSGIGRALVEALAERGGNVVLSSRSQEGARP